jgi:hypothetical protein
MTRSLTSCYLRRVAFLLVLSSPCFDGSAEACDTPVYRYAMYRWQPAPYELYYFHDSQPDAESEKVTAAVERRCTDEAAPANLIVLPVDLQQDKELAGVPPDVKEAWDRQSSKQTPWYLISSPVGVHIFGGTITESDIAALVDSPLRREVGQLMEQGKAGVYLLVTSDNQPADELAEKEIRGVIGDVAAGKISLYTAPSQSTEGNAPRVPAIEFGFVKVARNDANEKWLVDCLLAVAPDLRSSSEPLAFLIYGRGRALFSSLGKGIHRDNLIQDVEFITGACSCTVKEQNPGVDLLMSYDWNAVAESLSQQFGAEEGSPYRFGGDALFPELIIPPEEAPAPSDRLASGPGSPTQTVAPDASTIAAHPTETAAAPSSTAASANVVPSEAKVPQSSAARQLAANARPATIAESIESSPSDPWRAVLWVGGGLVGALVVLFGATFLVLRPR